jgi:hypothetical protein
MDANAASCPWFEALDLGNLQLQDNVMLRRASTNPCTWTRVVHAGGRRDGFSTVNGVAAWHNSVGYTTLCSNVVTWAILPGATGAVFALRTSTASWYAASPSAVVAAYSVGRKSNSTKFSAPAVFGLANIPAQAERLRQPSLIVNSAISAAIVAAAAPAPVRAAVPVSVNVLSPVTVVDAAAASQVCILRLCCSFILKTGFFCFSYLF